MDLKFTTAGDYVKSQQQRIGFACKYMHPDQSQKKKLLEEIQRPLNTRSTTVQWLNRQTVDVAEQRLWDIMVHNIAAYKRLIEYVGSLPPQLRMVRLGSDVLPVYTQHEWSYYWRKPDVRAYCETEFAKVGDTARALDVRLSMHPGQFTVLASDNPEIVERSIEEFEYHVDCIRWMGYGQSFQDFKCNVHISGRQGPAGIKAALKRSRTTKTSGDSTQASNLQTTLHWYSTYTITGAVKVNIYSPPTIDLLA
jgi:UV DNA damage endonuclease